MRTLKILACITGAVVLMSCKLGTPQASTTKDDVPSDSSSPDGSSQRLDSTCGMPMPRGTYAGNPAYANKYFFPAADGSDLNKFCRPSAGECNHSAAVIGAALCEDATQQPGDAVAICPTEDGPHPVFCYPAINP